MPAPQFQFTKDQLRDNDHIEYPSGDRYRVRRSGKGFQLKLELFQRRGERYELVAYDKCYERSLSGCRVWRRGPRGELVQIWPATPIELGA